MNIKNTLLFGIMSFMMLISIPNHVNAELKMGIVNLDSLFKEIPIYRESQSKIKKQFDPRARNLKTLETEWTTLNEKYLKNEKVMSESEKTSLVEKIKSIEKKFRTGQEKIKKDLQKVQADELSRIRGIVESAITKYAQDNDYDIVIRADGTTLFAKKYINITQEIISILQ